jgi:hypothetical protein
LQLAKAREKKLGKKRIKTKPMGAREKKLGIKIRTIAKAREKNNKNKGP